MPINNLTGLSVLSGSSTKDSKLEIEDGKMQERSLMIAVKYLEKG